MNAALPSVATTDSRGWVGRLELELGRVAGRSALQRRSHVGPLYVQRPFYPEGPDVVHLYVLHPPGGVVGGDRLDVSVRLAAGASALLTTPAAQKWYRSAGATSRLTTTLSVAAGATLEWLPSETIAFDAARARQTTRLELEPGAAAVAWEISCWGRPASGIRFDRGEVTLGFEIFRGAEPLLIERAHVAGGSDVLREAWGYASRPVAGVLYAVPAKPDGLVELAKRLRELPAQPGVSESVTALEELLVVRAFGDSSEAVRRTLVRAWTALRPSVIGRPATLPRIWAT
jgi:urease accessory protein